MGETGRRAALVPAVYQGARLAGAARPLVRRRSDQRRLQLPRSAPGHAPARQAGLDLGRRAGRHPPADATRAAPRSVQVRQRAQDAGHRARATWCRSTCRWCPSWPSPCWPARGSGRSIRSFSPASRRKRSPIATTTPGTKLQITADGAWRRGRQIALKQNVDAGAGQVAHGREVHRAAADRRRSRRSDPAATSGGTNSWPASRPIVRPSRWTAKRRCSSSTRAARPASPRAVDAHHGRLQPVRQEDLRVGVRPSRRRRLLVYGRPGLGHRPQLRRLRPAGGRGHDR